MHPQRGEGDLRWLKGSLHISIRAPWGPQMTPSTFSIKYQRRGVEGGGGGVGGWDSKTQEKAEKSQSKTPEETSGQEGEPAELCNHHFKAQKWFPSHNSLTCSVKGGGMWQAVPDQDQAQWAPERTPRLDVDTSRKQHWA